MINETNLIKRAKIFFNNNYDYICMKIFGRFGFIRKFIIINNLRKIKKIKKKNDRYFSTQKSYKKITSNILKFGFSEDLKVSRRLINKIIDYANNNYCYAYMDKRLPFLPRKKKKF